MVNNLTPSQVTSGLLPDGRHLIQRGREEAADWRNTYKSPIPVASLADRLGFYVSAYTLYSSVRPFGISAIVAGWDSEEDAPVDGQVGSGPLTGGGGRVEGEGIKRGGPGLYMIEPSGLYWGYYGAATGKGRQAAKAELEKLNLHETPPTLEEGVKEACRIIYVAHEDSKDKEFEVELTWVSGKTGPTKGRHEEVPEALRKEAERLAKKHMEGDDDEEGEKMQE
ncbi:hypothetical protein FH972_021497 [Carpinus fangiana]|uniref:Proteasome alpha-type subunits domain-containing protein n=1 Tax=Carpinus fangiana TaxID=176857 RepID=A0A5N6KQ41_9ROSI|nr:hypothetical protein FH972_021497 [Carpinus fangiana]